MGLLFVTVRGVSCVFYDIFLDVFPHQNLNFYVINLEKILSLFY